MIRNKTIRLESSIIRISKKKHFKITALWVEKHGNHLIYETCSYAVVLLMSWTLCSGSMVSGQRRIQGAKTIANALADIRFVSSCRAILDTWIQHLNILPRRNKVVLCIYSFILYYLADFDYLTRWKTRRSRVFKWVLLSWSITEYTPLIISFLSCKPGETFQQGKSLFPAAANTSSAPYSNYILQAQSAMWCILGTWKHNRAVLFVAHLPMARMNSSYSSNVIRGLGISRSHCLKTLAITWML